MANLYATLAGHIATSIDKGIYLPGDRLPGVRSASENEGVSPATVVSAYHHLEREGYIEARPRSGYYVKPRLQYGLQEPRTTKPSKSPQPVTGQSLVLRLIQNISDPNIIQLGANAPDSSYLPDRAIERAINKAMRHTSGWNATYQAPPGLPALRQQIAKRMSANGCITHPDHITITSGCQEAIFLTLKSVTKPGDIVAIESPTYYGLLQVIDTLGLKALEIPTDPRTGISITALQLALEQWPVKACVVVPNFNNPTGALMPDDAKQALVTLINRHEDVTLIEDDIYGDLFFDGRRPGLLKSLDIKGNVVHCASFSKTLSPALRIGWIASEALSDTVQYQKFVTNCATNTLGQLTVSDLLASGYYDKHLKSLRLGISQSISRILENVVKYFPADVKASRPAGGMSLWLELPKGTNTTHISNQALTDNISVAPGAIFSSSPIKYQHCLRLNCAVAWSPRVEQALKTLGKLASQ
ncbi:MAG: DNA-binding transcriptional MocR family regulator [Patiriisocius sp.]|jgi:DNA-binding transcriptional MocR family regulator